MDTSQILLRLGFALEKDQPHISGERFLLAPNKQVLVGRQLDTNQRVIIKISHLIKGKQEIRQEKKVRDILMSFAFSRKVMFFPKEIFFGLRQSYLILITEFIEQDKVFVARTLSEQTAIIMHSFKTREAFHAKTFNRVRKASKTFPILRSQDYLTNFGQFKKTLGKNLTMEQAEQVLQTNAAVIEKHGNYLIHGDFVPHNFRVRDGALYILDYSAFHFGNKYEEWARLLNYMVIYNPSLEKKLRLHVLTKRSASDYLDLRLMRIYKIGQLLDFYTRSLPKTTAKLHTLTNFRIKFWQTVLKSVLEDKPVADKTIKAYIKARDRLRSAEEKKRQKEFTLV